MPRGERFRVRKEKPVLRDPVDGKMEKPKSLTRREKRSIQHARRAAHDRLHCFVAQEDPEGALIDLQVPARRHQVARYLDLVVNQSAPWGWGK